VQAEGSPTSFAGNMTLGVHRWFRYSAGFSADWTHSEIRRLGASRVLDPFAGSGTTLLAAQSAGAESVGIDSHSFVARIARAKLNWTGDPDILQERADAALVIADSLVIDTRNVAELTRRCFPAAALGRLLAIGGALEVVAAGDGIDSLLWLALMAILRTCSPVGTAQWQYVLPRQRKASAAVPDDAFARQVARMAGDMARRQADLPRPPPARYLEADIRSGAGRAVPAGWADLVITSPPYANNFDYADATRLEMTFLGEVRSWADLAPLRQALIRSSVQQAGNYPAARVLRAASELEVIRDELATVYHQLAAARLTKGGRKAYHSMIVAYFHDMSLAWRQIRTMTAAGADVCFVVGDSAPYGVHVPVERWLGDLAVAAGFAGWRFEKVRERNVKWHNRKHRVPLHEGRLWVRG
jgi:hypothetical protein